ncbi:MAG: 4-hydroxybutyrate CoA-transferase, partial [Anaerolineae bacterium]|nr:4-hydroxybutyrate CoA-transferase [Anaerolineae bacterium]
MSWRDRIITAEEAAAKVQSGNRIFFTGNCSTPIVFQKALLDRHEELREVELIQVLDFGTDKPYVTPDLAEHIRVNNYFIGPTARAAVSAGLADYTPIFLSEIPLLFRSGRTPLDVAVIQVSPPDQHGYCSFGVEVGVSKSAAETAGMVIAEVNPAMPRTLGDSFIHVDQINFFIEVHYPLAEVIAPAVDEKQVQIAKYIAEHIPDAATLQTGIGGIP